MANRRNYAVQGTRNVISASQTMLTLTSTSAVRPNVYDCIFGSSATPADNAILWTLQRITAAGTNTAYTPVALDPGDPAATAVAGINNTVEPTYTANAFLLRVALNQRATHRWIADPDGPLRLPATASNGIGWLPTNASFTGAVDVTQFHYE